MTKPGMRERLRYAFDNTMAKGTLALIAWLAVLSLGVILLATVVAVALQIRPADADGDPGAIEVAWMSLMRTLDPGTMGGDAGWGFRVTMLIVTLGGIFIVGTLIGVLTTGIQGAIERLRKGRSFVMEEGHTLILGWSSKIHTIISELTIANENQKKPRIVVANPPFNQASRSLAVTPDASRFVAWSRGEPPVFTLMLDWAAGLGK